MKTARKLWKSYYTKLVLALCVSAAIGSASGIGLLGGTALVCFNAFYLIFSFQDDAFRKKKQSEKTVVYFFLALFLLAGMIIASGSPDQASQMIRQQIGKALAG